MRHVGTIQNTGSRVILAFLQLPEAPHKCLCIQVDSLPEYYREVLNRLVQSDEGQNATELYTVLGRYKMEGVNKDLLTVLHQAGQLLSLPIDNILMNPMPNHSFPLREVLTSMGRIVPHGMGQKSDQYAEPKRFNQFEQNQQADLDGNRMMIATSKIRQAQLLESDAKRYRDEAYEMVPSLRPVSANAPEPLPAAMTPPADFSQQIGAMEGIASSYTGESDTTQLNLFPDTNPNA